MKYFKTQYQTLLTFGKSDVNILYGKVQENFKQIQVSPPVNFVQVAISKVFNHIETHSHLQLSSVKSSPLNPLYSPRGRNDVTVFDGFEFMQLTLKKQSPNFEQGNQFPIQNHVIFKFTGCYAFAIGKKLKTNKLDSHFPSFCFRVVFTFCSTCCFVKMSIAYNTDVRQNVPTRACDGKFRFWH